MLSDFGVKLHAESVIDIQLLEVAARPSYCSIGRCMSYRNVVAEYADLRADELSVFLMTKDTGKRIFCSGDYSVLRQRPLTSEFVQYSAGDVVYMPRLWGRFVPGMAAGNFWGAVDGSRDRVNGIGHSYLADSPWKKFGDSGPGVEAPWLYDQRHYLEIMSGKEIDNRTEWEKHHVEWEEQEEKFRLEQEAQYRLKREEYDEAWQASHVEMNQTFDEIESERRQKYDKKFQFHYSGILGCFRKIIDYLYIWSGRSTRANKYAGDEYMDWEERKWRLQHGLEGEIDQWALDERWEDFENDWSYPPEPRYYN